MTEHKRGDARADLIFNRFTNIHLARNVRAKKLGHHIFLITPNPFAWVAISTNLSNALALCNGGNVGQIEVALRDSEFSVRDFLRPLASGGFLENIPVGRPQPSPKPVLLRLEMTYACNLKCAYCYNESGPTTIASRMSLDLLMKSVDFAFRSSHAKQGVRVHFHGGEALIEWDNVKKGIKYIIETYGERLKEISISTNGTLLDEEKIRFLTAHHVRIRLSFDGLPDIHDLFRPDLNGEGSSGGVLKAMKRLQGYPHLGVLVTVTEKCSAKLMEIVQFLQQYHVAAVSFRLCRSTGRGLGIPGIRTDARSYIDGMKRIVNRICDGDFLDIRIETLMRLLLPLLTAESVYGGEPRCGIGRDELTVTTSGIIKCDMLPPGLIPSPGNIGSGVDNQSLARIADMVKNKESSCRDCLWRALCGGGCVGNAWCESSRLDGKDRLQCQIQQELFPFLLEKLAVQPNRLTAYFEKHLSGAVNVSCKSP